MPDKPPPKFHIHPARSKEDIATVATLFSAYADSLGLDLSFQSFAEEVTGLPGRYAPPSGELLLAFRAEDDSSGNQSSDARASALGCIAVRPLLHHDETGNSGQQAEGDKPRRCEFKRFYVCPEARGSGLGLALAEAVIRKAAELGYDEAVIDTLPSMQSAIRLYARLGFTQIPAYYETPLSGTLFYKLDLAGLAR